MFEAPDSPWLVPFDGSFRVADIIIDASCSIGVEYPEPSAEERAEIEQSRKELDGE